MTGSASLLTPANFPFAFHEQGSREEEMHPGHRLWMASVELRARDLAVSPLALLDWTMLYE